MFHLFKNSFVLLLLLIPIIPVLYLPILFAVFSFISGVLNNIISTFNNFENNSSIFFLIIVSASIQNIILCLSSNLGYIFARTHDAYAFNLSPVYLTLSYSIHNLSFFIFSKELSFFTFINEMKKLILELYLFKLLYKVNARLK